MIVLNFFIEKRCSAPRVLIFRKDYGVKQHKNTKRYESWNKETINKEIVARKTFVITFLVLGLNEFLIATSGSQSENATSPSARKVS